MNKSESIAKLAAALVAVQREIENVHKNATNPHFRSNYADLAEIINTVRPVLSKHGITVVQVPGFSDGICTLETLIAHESGEWISGVSGSPIQKDDPQGVGSAVTYLRRYSLASICAIAQEDDDGNAASAPRSVDRPAAQPTASGSAKKDDIPCPACGGEMWDNRAKKASGQFKANSPDFACKDRESCNTAVWVEAWRDDLLKRIAAVHAAEIIDVDTRMQAEGVAKGKDPHLMVKLNARVEQWELEVEKARLGAEPQGSLV